MSNSQSTNINLAQAQAVRSSGYRTKVHELPEFKTWFDREVKAGGKTIPQLRREALSLFPSYATRFPSVKRLYSYAGKYLTETVKVQPFLPQYAESMRDYDSYLELQQIAREGKRQYYATQKLGNFKQNVRWFDNWFKATSALFDAEMRMGLRDQVIVENHLAIYIRFKAFAQSIFSGNEVEPNVKSDVRSVDEIRKRLAMSKKARDLQTLK